MDISTDGHATTLDDLKNLCDMTVTTSMIFDEMKALQGDYLCDSFDAEGVAVMPPRRAANKGKVCNDVVEVMRR